MDAQYFLIKDSVPLLLWVNENLVKAVKWQNDPEIYHEKVHLGGDLSIFYPDWAHELVIPNNVTPEELSELTHDYLRKLKDETNK